MKKHPKKKGMKHAAMISKPAAMHADKPAAKGMRSYAANRKMMKAY